ncbi:MAG: hypothetical protein HOJ85_09710 [Ilumatobacter sp.]|uniref:hypothetical protein n=1 Tax=Ilumatobacter sp. TaxID=1967498 RepID=UPI001D8D7290|nr:hypothetical protein [Ilumatobacter sp.]MBT5554027.1 hypothetical protein [Ilumatobacter sp.]MBT5866599.1 hypothetical protein [Ilumatobacter sp.]MBT7429710.1 hypothetical protein [Ilumatobacter sp.]MDG0977874.1 hypothetical protein [Ilumatobacter sp.]
MQRLRAERGSRGQPQLQDNTRRWVVVTALIGVVTGVLMVLLGMEPRLVLVGFVVIVATAATWLILDVGQATAPVNWHNYGAAEDAVTRPDRRVQVLKARLRQPTRRGRALGSVGATPTGRADPSDEIGDSLVEVLDDHLVADRGIDRSEDPVGAAEALGPELMQFVSDPAVRRSMTQRRTLVRTVTSIEAFTTHSPDSN